MAMAASSYGGQNVMLMRSGLGSANSLVAMLSGFQVPRATGGLEDAVAGCGGKRLYYGAFEGGAGEEVDEDGDDDAGCSHPVEKKRRLSSDQLHSLERSFEAENKLEPERKMQLAKDLGLQPRQVAVWFQNRRARWKTKQLERDYEVLNSGYLKLKADFEATLREKDALKAEVQRLSGSSSQSAHSSPSEPEALKSHAKRALMIEVCKEKEDSASSELLDADSPRTTASNRLSRLHDDLACDFAFDGAGDAFSVKLEDGTAFPANAACHYLLPPAATPWWDWA